MGTIFENLRPLGFIVRESVPLIPVLVEHHIALVLCGQFLRQPDSPIAASRAGGSNDVGTVQFEQSALILRSLLRYHGGKWIAFHIRHQSQGYPWISACPLP